MAYAIVNRYPGGTKENYDKTVAVVHPPGGLPPGQSHHFAGAVDDGWLVIAIWDSRQSWERFRDDTLMPALQGGVAGGFDAAPELTEVELDTVMSG